MRTYFYPAVGQFNPYLSLLADSIERKDSNISIVRQGIPSLRAQDILRFPKGKSVVHLHWILEPAKTPNPFATLAAYWPILRAFIFMTLLKILYDTKVVWSVHDAKRLHTQPFWTPLLWKWADALADSYIFHCDAAKREHALQPSKPAYVIPHGHEVGQYGAPITDQESARRLLGLNKEDTVFLIFGQWRPYKRLEWLLPRLHEFPVKHVKFVLAGMTHSEHEFRVPPEVMQDSRFIIIDSFVPSGYVRWLYAAADYLVIAQHRGYVSGAMVLALSYGIPVLTLDWCCNPTVVRDGINGFLFNETTLFLKLQQAMKLRQQPRRYQSMRKAAVKKISQFDWPTIGGKTGAVYHQLFAQNARR